MPKFKFDKLVRDKVVDDQIASGAKPAYRALDPDEHRQELVRKIVEEAQEILKAPLEELAGELADVQQAIDDLRDLCGLSPADIAQAQEAKNEKKGAFKKGVYVDYVEVSEDNPWISHWRKNADRYPEIQ